MPSERWLRAEELFAAALARAAGEREAFLTHACGDDDTLREDVASLLRAADQSDAFLAAPALEVFSRQIAREGWSVQPGDRIASYTITRRLGAGGAGEVWQARDDRLARDVAVKLLLPHPSNGAARVLAFQDEARAAGSLNHPNVLTVYDIGEHGGAPYLVTECLEGESLRTRLAAGALPVDAALDIALQVARGLDAAHARGIVHRDLKPENIFLTSDGRAKILDFGLAVLQGARAEHRAGAEGLVIAGTAGYMAPEQVRGDPVDERADVFALGAVLHEMLAGRRAFMADTSLGALEAVLTREPEDLTASDPAVAREIAAIVRRCLAKAPADRYANGGAVATALDRIVQARRLRSTSTLLALARRPAVAVTVLVLVFAIALGAWRWNVSATRARWARSTAAPEIQRLEDAGDLADAFLLARRALDVLPDDPQLKQLWLDVSVPATIDTIPSGADVVLAPYARPEGGGLALGRTPLKGVRIPRTLVRVRVSKRGFEPIEGSMTPPGAHFRLDPIGAAPAGMVRAVNDPAQLPAGLIGGLDDYWIDRFEVTNSQFKAFVDAGGYGRAEYWREPFVEHGETLPWREAMGRFRDATGRPGPATWAGGTYRDGQGVLPVGGVSWYEAAAYAAFAGRSLPTIHHWFNAAGRGRYADILIVSNFSEKGPAPVGSYHGVGPFGTYDMAGNLKEWCSTETAGRRFLLGGAWNEPRYMFGDYDARDPFERAPADGFRLARYDRPLPPAVTAPVPLETLIDTRTRTPVRDEIFDVYRREYAYDPSPLNALVETTEETDLFVKQVVTFDAAYGGERVRAYLFLPKAASPPYQTIVFFPAADAFRLASSRDMSLLWMDFLVRSGRAFVYPVYKGTYERQTQEATGANAERDLGIAISRDLGRTIDYLETRPDVDLARLAFYGVSAGADIGPVMVALEPRLKLALLQGAGVGGEGPPESDSINFAPRVRVPTLMLNGRYDFERPYVTSQEPLFALLGTPAGLKRHAILDTGHALSTDLVASEVLPWLDRYFGPVNHAAPPPAAGRRVP